MHGEHTEQQYCKQTNRRPSRRTEETVDALPSRHDAFTVDRRVAVMAPLLAVRYGRSATVT
jgi:hypothetical protein